MVDDARIWAAYQIMYHLSQLGMKSLGKDAFKGLMASHQFIPFGCCQVLYMVKFRKLRSLIS